MLAGLTWNKKHFSSLLTSFQLLEIVPDLSVDFLSMHDLLVDTRD